MGPVFFLLALSGLQRRFLSRWVLSCNIVGPLLQYCGSSLCSTLTYICPILSSMCPIMSSLPCNICRSCEFSRPLVGSWVHIRFLYNIGINAMLPSAICQLCAWLLCNIGTIRVKGRLSRISSVSELHRDNVDLPLGAGQQLSMCILNCLLAPAKLGTSEFDTFFIWDCVVIAIKHIPSTII